MAYDPPTMNEMALIVGGPLDGKSLAVPRHIGILDTPTGRYTRDPRSRAVPLFVWNGPLVAAVPTPAPVKPPDRWAKKKRPNPFTKAGG